MIERLVERRRQAKIEECVAMVWGERVVDELAPYAVAVYDSAAGKVEVMPVMYHNRYGTVFYRENSRRRSPVEKQRGKVIGRAGDENMRVVETVNGNVALILDEKRLEEGMQHTAISRDEKRRRAFFWAESRYCPNSVYVLGRVNDVLTGQELTYYLADFRERERVVGGGMVSRRMKETEELARMKAVRFLYRYLVEVIAEPEKADSGYGGRDEDG